MRHDPPPKPCVSTSRSEQINIAPMLADFAGMSSATYESLGRVSQALQSAVYGKTRYAAFLTAADFEVAKSFFRQLDAEFMLIGVMERDDEVDQGTLGGYSSFGDRMKL